MQNIKYSIIIPAYNEEKIIADTIDKALKFFSNSGKTFELIIANDGSNDGTANIVSSKIAQYRELKLFNNLKNEGRGSVLSNSFKTALGSIIVYIDADLAIDLELFPKLVSAIEEKNVDMAIGSKHLKESMVEYPSVRRIFSKAYSFIARLLLGTSIRDYQCGFKAFRRDAIIKILPYIKSKGWTWDTEVLVKARWLGYNIEELPAKVINIYGRESKVHLFNDVKLMGLGLLRLYREKKNFRK